MPYYAIRRAFIPLGALRRDRGTWCPHTPRRRTIDPLGFLEEARKNKMRPV